ncbi:MAG: DUF1330 domain-containing protein [Enterocloster sp.]
MVYFAAAIYFDETRDGKNYLDYIRIVKPIVEKYQGRYLIRSEKITALGNERRPDRMIVIEFDSREQLEQCFSSEEYRKIACLRENSVISRAVIAEQGEKI